MLSHVDDDERYVWGSGGGSRLQHSIKPVMKTRDKPSAHSAHISAISPNLPFSERIDAIPSYEDPEPAEEEAAEPEEFLEEET